MALPPDYIEEIKRILESISGNLPGYTPRHSQKKMIAAVAEVLSRANDAPQSEDGEEPAEPPENTGHSILCVQGPTGVGKSLGYLIGAVVAARAMGRKVVISSATVALQQQLVSRDVPFFVKNSGLPLTFAIAKGRTRYVCHHKLSGIADGGAQDDMFEVGATWERKPEETEVKRLGEMLSDYESRRWSGDRDEMKEPVPDELWSRVTTDRHGCLNRGCKSFSTCAQMAARNQIHDVDIVVSNHDLLLADIALGGGVILPNPSKTFYVLDEAHHIANKAVESFSNQHQVKAGQMLMEKLSTVSGRVGQVFPDLSALTAPIDTGAEYLGDALSDGFLMLDSIDKALFAGNGNLWRFENNELPEGAESISSNIIKTSSGLLVQMAKLLEDLGKKKKTTPDDVRLDKFLTDISFFSGRVGNINDTWVALSQPNSDDLSVPPVAKWVVYEQKKQGKFDFSVCACPVSAADELAATFFKRANGVILTSATLMTLGNFDQLLRETGLGGLPDTALLSLPSPFNFAEQGVLSIPDMKASPKDAKAHTAEIIVRLPGIIEQTGNRGTLILFSSRRQMMEVAEGLRAGVRSKVLIQGECPKDVLLAEHYRRIDSEQPSVLFGLQSFAEGLDLPGAYCAHVVITKIPFAVPSDPVQETLDEWLSKRNQSYFNEIAVPQACLRMIQAAGRLIRTESDTGMLTILDGRLNKTRYGKLIKDSLPPFRLAA